MVRQLMMYRNVIVGITLCRCSFVFSQSRVGVSATLTDVGSLAIGKNNSFKNCSQPDDHTIRCTDTAGFKPLTTLDKALAGSNPVLTTG